VISNDDASFEVGILAGSMGGDTPLLPAAWDIANAFFLEACKHDVTINSVLK